MKTDLKEEYFGSAFGRRARLFTLSNGVVSAAFTDFGASLVSFRLKGGTEAVLSYDDAAGYALGSSYLGATVGRYAGRIGNAAFTLDGKEFSLPRNDGENHLHGGFSKRFFYAEIRGEELVLTLVSPDGDEGFPGEVRLALTVSLKGASLVVRYEAETDKKTVVNFTNHAYFNLDGSKNPVGGHVLKVFSDTFAETDAHLIPTGRLVPTAGTPLDLNSGAPLSGIVSDVRLAATRGLDHSFILDGEGLKKAAELSLPETGLTLTVSTTQPTVHVYTGGFLDGDTGEDFRGGIKKKSWLGVALETQRLPDSPNKPDFPKTELAPGERYKETTVYTLSSAIANC
ncbi:MAG: galactose mutarotase [Clostridiales bacterium]|nr:galactose mutarotase [Clostridiales bacterium]